MSRPGSCATKHFVSQVRTILERLGLAPEFLEIELTESATMEDLDHSLEILTALSELGVRLVIDDFGTGYSSLARLRQLPIDGIKVDRSFIEHIAEDSKERSLVMAIVAMASNLGLSGGGRRRRDLRSAPGARQPGRAAGAGRSDATGFRAFSSVAP